MNKNVFFWSEKEQALYTEKQQKLNPWTWTWSPIETTPSDLSTIDALSALGKLSSQLRRLPIAVIGPREASEQEYQMAEQLGAALAKAGLQLLCGGKNGVMEASAKGHLEAGGQPIGLIPETDWTEANPYISIPIASGIGKARNVLIAQACPVLIAVGGGYGTMSEMAFGLHFEKLILALGEAPQLPGVVFCQSVDEAMTQLSAYLLASDK